MSFLLNLLQFFDPLAWSQQSRRRAWFWNFDHLYDLLRLWVPFLLLAKIQAMRRTRWRTEMKSSMVRVDQWAATLFTIDSMVEESRFILVDCVRCGSSCRLWPNEWIKSFNRIKKLLCPDIFKLLQSVSRAFDRVFSFNLETKVVMTHTRQQDHISMGSISKHCQRHYGPRRWLL